MKIKSALLIAAVAALLAGSAAVSAAAETPKDDAALAAKLITAIEKSDYAAFVADGEPRFQQLPKPQFEAVAAQLAPKLQAGYQLSYLGELRQRGYRVTLWKVVFKDGSDDALATLSVKDGKEGGFWIP